MVVGEKDFLHLIPLTITIATVVDDCVRAKFDVEGVFWRRVISKWCDTCEECV